MVVVPTILSSVEGIDDLLETLEIHHLANRDPHLHFALLTDLRDAAEENLPEDEALLERARAGIESLNRKYAAGRRDLFFLFHRPAPLERGRGRLDGLRTQARKADAVQRLSPRALRGMLFGSRRRDRDSSLDQIRHHARYRHAVAARVGPPARRHDGASVEPAAVRSGARDCDGGLQHSATARGREPAERAAFWFVRLHAGEAGIDPYTRAVSDVYQDLFQRRLVHRQRDLRGRCLRARAGRPLPGEHES